MLSKLEDKNVNVINSPIKDCKDRVAKTIEKLPRNYVDIIFHHYPEYNTRQGYRRITNVKSLRAADLRLTVIFEKIASGELKLESKS